MDRFQQIELSPEHKVLGKKYRAELPKVLAELNKINSDNLLSQIEAGNANLGGYEITMEDVSIRRVEKEGYAASTFTVDNVGDISLVLDMSLNDSLISKGLAREITRRIQSKRKDLDLELEATISLNVWLSEDSPKLASKDWEYVKFETRASNAELFYSEQSDASDTFEVEEKKISFNLKLND